MNTLFVSLVLVLSLSSFSHAQLVCTTMGAYTTCTNANGQQTTQSQLSPNMGVIHTPNGMTPYTILPTPQTHGIQPLQPLQPLTPVQPTPPVAPILIVPGY